MPVREVDLWLAGIGGDCWAWGGQLGGSRGYDSVTLEYLVAVPGRGRRDTLLGWKIVRW
ncbi:hypothetical protein [Microbulbifer sp. TYP-18]|uniref:hypothetical protein n=1 Tax=Microbulbifer sp. TYP-18 TaxID=3230024 RepID=UPI0034C5B320